MIPITKKPFYLFGVRVDSDAKNVKKEYIVDIQLIRQLHHHFLGMFKFINSLQCLVYIHGPIAYQVEGWDKVV